jgi:L-amino acid N-acyltransferase YncA
VAALRIRPAAESDAEALLAVYRPFVESTTVSFEIEVPTPEEFAQRIRKALVGWQWLVATEGQRCLGYAYASAHRERAAYRWSVEVSAYVHPSSHRRGIGRALYEQLLQDLASKGFCNAYAGIALPNEASVALHRSVGFVPVGTFKSIGRKFGRWQDVAWFQRALRESPPEGSE